MNNIISLLFLIVFNANVQHLNGNLIDNACQQANVMGQAFLKDDYQTFAKYTYPALLSAMGGKTVWQQHLLNQPGIESVGRGGEQRRLVPMKRNVCLKDRAPGWGACRD